MVPVPLAGGRIKSGVMQIQTPDWVKHAVFYQIFPDRFARSQQPRKRLLKNATWEDWHAMPTLQGYKGETYGA